MLTCKPLGRGLSCLPAVQHILGSADGAIARRGEGGGALRPLVEVPVTLGTSPTTGWRVRSRKCHPLPECSFYFSWKCLKSKGQPRQEVRK